MTKREQDRKWKEVLSFGKGKVFARGNHRKIVTPDLLDFEYEFVPQLGQPTEPSSLLPEAVAVEDKS